MSRLLISLLAALLVFPAGARAQATQPAPKPAAQAKPATPTKAAAQPATPAKPGAQAPAAKGVSDLDPATRDLVRREIEKAKEEMRDELRQEIQSAQSAQEFMAVNESTERPKLEFLQLNGYLRVRGDLFDNFDLHRQPDSSQYFLFPRPLFDSNNRGTLTTGNMRFRLEPTINVSEQVRVLSQIDMLDNIVLGSTPLGTYARSDGVVFPFDARGQVPPQNGVNADRSSIVVKRAWAEVQTPFGLLSFGRMPSSWGLGILSYAGNGIDDDLGDSVDRVQFAVAPLKTPVGPLVLVPMYEMVATGVTTQDASVARGLGQPFDRDKADDCKAAGFKLVRMDTDEEMKRKFERNEASVSYGLWYMWKSQGWEFPAWVDAPSISATSTGTTQDANVGQAVRRDAFAHTVDLWGRYQTKRLRVEGEFVAVVGEIGNAAPIASGKVLLRQFGGVAQGAYKLMGGKLTVGGELGFASGDTNPGFGNRPGRKCTANFVCQPTLPGDFDGLQFGPGDRVMDIRNFRFNPGYRVDMILWREILQGVTDAWYLKPSARYEIFEGLSASLGLIYSQAMYANSTPSTDHKPLGIEVDAGLQYQSDDGFVAWLNYGMLQPLSGLEYATGAAPTNRDISRAHAVRAGFAVKF